MKTLMGLLLFVAMTTSIPASAGGWCQDSDYAAKIATQAALSINAVSGGMYPLTIEAHSLSSKPNSYGVILSYSGVQYTYIVMVRSQDCRVLSVVLGR